MMNCCDEFGNCRQGRDCPIRTQKTITTVIQKTIIRGLVFLGMFATAMFLLGYAWASMPPVLDKICTPTFIDRIFK
jgi:hypothetical protein